MDTSNSKPTSVQPDPTGIQPGGWGWLRTVALVTTGIGALGSLALTLFSGRGSPPVLQVGFALWVLAPFAALAWANLVSLRWSTPVRISLASVTFVITLVSWALYGKLIPAPPGTAHAFVFVATPPAAWLTAGILVPLVAFFSRGSSKK